jgi:hypothetical protein
MPAAAKPCDMSRQAQRLGRWLAAKKPGFERRSDPEHFQVGSMLAGRSGE